MGDIILATPLLRSLKMNFPDAGITYVIKKQFADLIAASPYVNEIVCYDSAEGFKGLKTLRKHLSKKPFDLCIDIHKNWRSYYLRFGISSRYTTAYSKQIIKRSLLVYCGINIYNSIKPVYIRYFESVRRFKIAYDNLGTEVFVPEEARNKVHHLLVKSGYTFDQPLVVFCPGATYFTKRWKSEGFVETARSLINDHNVFVIIHGGKADIELCSNIAQAIGFGAFHLAGQLNLIESAALLGFAKLVVANDSGLLHMAQAQKIPVVGIYGSTTKELGYFPLETNSTVVEVPLKCRPCTHNGLHKCPKKHFHCMNMISTNKVISAIMPYLT
jgi:heptosyltransferase-2